MHIVSHTSDQERASHRALKEVGWCLRDLTANLLRVTRGAGKPADIGPQAFEFVQAMETYRLAAGCYPSAHDLRGALDLDIFRSDESLSNWTDWDYALRDMVKGALQIAASNLVGQATQASAGRSELFDGLAVIEKIREDNRTHRSRSKRRKVELD